MTTYFAYFKIAFKGGIAYKSNWWFGVLNTCLQIFISCAIWKALYGGNEKVSGISFMMLTTNFILAQGLGNVFSVNDFAVQGGISSGSIALDLLKPISYRSMLLARDLGAITSGLLSNFLPSLILACIFIRMLPPVSPAAFLMFCVSIVFGFGILWAISAIVQMTSFWIINVWSVSTIKNVLVNILAGASLPLWFMPPFLMNIIRFTPFDSIYYTPIQIYLGRIRLMNALPCLGKQLVWFALLFLVGHCMWRSGKKRIIVQGG